MPIPRLVEPIIKHFPAVSNFTFVLPKPSLSVSSALLLESSFTINDATLFEAVTLNALVFGVVFLTSSCAPGNLFIPSCPSKKFLSIFSK